MVFISTGTRAQKLAVLTAFVFFGISLQSSDIKPPEAQEKSIWAGTKDKTPETKYNASGLPKNRKWLTSKEWKGAHITDPSTKEKFKAWKSAHITQFIKFFTAAAREEAGVYKDIPPALYISQAILESNYGLSRLAR